jgi:membrane protein implicated in regulation of membrane protease activity
VLFGLFGLFLLGHSLTGYAAYNADQHAHQQPPIRYAAYLVSGHLWGSVWENWESEFLQMAAYVLLTVWLFQRGSAESKDPDIPEEVDEDPSTHQHDPDAPGPVRRGGLALRVYQHSLALALFGLFFLSFVGHGVSGAAHYNAEQRTHSQPTVSVLHYMGTSQFWFESFQNWQSEFLAVGALVVLSIWLRERGSPESKPVHKAHTETGR